MNSHLAFEIAVWISPFFLAVSQWEDSLGRHWLASLEILVGSSWFLALSLGGLLLLHGFPFGGLLLGKLLGCLSGSLLGCLGGPAGNIPEVETTWAQKRLW